MEQTNVALIVGVTGMAGLSIAEALKSPAALGGPWAVYGAARRPRPDWFPPFAVDEYITFDVTDAGHTRRQLSPVRGRVTHVFWVAINATANEDSNVATNSAMLANASKLIEPAPRQPLTYSVHRSSIIIGASSRSVYKMLLTLAVYAAVCRHEGLPFRYPGSQYTWEHFCDMSDAHVLAEQQIWASVTDKAHNEAFNCTNGDVFTWKRIWKALSEVFEVEFVEYEEGDEFDVVRMMKDKGKVWDEVVEKHGPYRTKMEEVCCFAAMQTVLRFGFQHVCSMNKSRDFGFMGYADTLRSVGMWVNRLRQMNIIP